MSEKLVTEVEWKGTSAATIKKITDAGILTIDQLLTFTPKELAEKIEVTSPTVDKVILQALKEYGLDFKKGTTVAEEQAKRIRLSTGSKEFDRLMKGGVEGEALTEFIAEYHGGKTQLCMTMGVLAVNLPPNEAGQNPHVVYIDCENTFKANRVMEIARERGFNPEETLNRFLVATAYNSLHQAELIKHIDKILSTDYFILVIVDGVLSHLRGEYIGRETLAPRQGSLGAMLGRLLSIASSNKIPIILTNQVQGNVTGFGSPFNPAGGHVMAHACTHRVLIRTKSKNSREVQVIDSPDISDEERVRIAITAAGIVDEGDADE